MSQNLTDDEREQLITTTGMFFAASETHAMRKFWWDINRQLVLQRSAFRVEQMEREKGLRND